MLRLRLLILSGCTLLAVASLITFRFSFHFPTNWGGSGFPRREFLPETLGESLRTYAPVGTLYGWLPIACWLSTFLARLPFRFIAMAIVVITIAKWMPFVSTLSVTESGASAAMLALATSLGIHWLGVPHFSQMGSQHITHNLNANSSMAHRKQFSIGAVIVLTIVAAVLFCFIGQTTLRSSTPASLFWGLYVLTTFGMALAAILLFRVFGSQRIWRDKWIDFLLSTGILFSCMLLLSTLDQSHRAVGGLWHVTQNYGSLLMTYWGFNAAFAAWVLVARSATSISQVNQMSPGS